MMKRFVARTLIFFLLLVIIDLLLGVFFDYALGKATLTDFGRDNHITNIGKEDLLVFGSSRAVHHYNTKMLEDSLDMECYNCGEDGQGIILNYGRLLMEKERHQPRIVIYDIQPDYDIEENDNSTYLKWLKPHYDREGIGNIVASVDKKESLKLMSHLYRYNSEYILLLIALAHSSEVVSDNGFCPLNGIIDSTQIDKDRTDKAPTIKIDSLKILYLHQFIKEMNEGELVFVISPTWYGKKAFSNYESIETICKEHGITFIDFSNSPKYVHNNDLFKDGMHLNNKGADEFTKDLIKLLKKANPPTQSY